MSQITRCPSCATLFKVVPDQLRISEGWVRCGQCKEVFDATLSLQEAPAPAADPVAGATGPAPAPSPGPAPQSQSQSQSAPPAEVLHPAAAAPAGEPLPMAQPAPQEPQEPQVLQPQGYELPAAVLPEAQEDGWALDDNDNTPPAPPVPSVLQGAAPAERQGAGDAGAGADDCAAASVAAGQDTLAAALLSTPSPETSEKTDATDAPGASGNTEETQESAKAAPVFTQQGQRQEQASGRVFFAQGADNGPHPAGRSEAAALSAAAELPAQTPVSAPVPVPVAAEADADGAIAAADEHPHPLVGTPMGPVLTPDAAPEPSFVRTARRKALWHRPAMRLALGGCAVLLAAVLLAQVAVQQRHYLASAQPQWRPLLQALCGPLHCDVAAYQNIAAVAVDSSSFNKLRGTTYQFALALQNQSAVAVATPAVELTLTDSADQPVLRRVLQPAALSAPDTLAAGGEWSGSVQMELRLDGPAQARIAGYRVLAFYP